MHVCRVIYNSFECGPTNQNQGPELSVLLSANCICAGLKFVQVLKVLKSLNLMIKKKPADTLYH